MFKQIYSDIFLVYKNFIHWNISKIIISIVSVLFGILLALPFLLLAILIWYLSPIDWKSIIWAFYMWNSLDIFLLSELFKNIVYFVFIIFLAIFWVLAFFLWSSYKYPLISKLYLSYIDGEKRNFFKGNNYFSLKKLWKYTCVLAWLSLYMILPLIIFLVFFIFLLFSFGWLESVSSMMDHSIVNVFSMLLLMVFVLSLILFFYITYRVQFSLFSFIDNKYYDVNKRAKYFVKDSILLTKSYKVFGQYLLLLISMIVILAPFFLIESNILWKQKELELLVSAKTDEVFQKTMTEDNKYEVSLLEKKYINFNEEDLKYELSKSNAYLNIWGILYFLFLGNIETMLFVSFYRKILIGDKMEVVEEKEEELKNEEEVL